MPMTSTSIKVGDNPRLGSGRSTSGRKQKKREKVFVIKTTIFKIFMFFSGLAMLGNLFVLVFGLCLTRLLEIIEVGAKPPTLLNRQILAQVGSINSLEAFAVV